MKNIAWKDEYNIGLQEIDSQHQFFLKLINKIIDNSSDSDAVDNLIEELLLYTRFHFKSEENIMMQLRYPLIQDHQKIHLDLISKLSDLITTSKIKQNQLSEIIDFLVDWFIIHTTTEDKKIAIHEKSQN